MHIFNLKENVAEGTLSGGHYLPTLPPYSHVTIIKVSEETGAAIVDLLVENTEARDGVLTKNLHTVFNPAWTELEVLEEIDSAYQNQYKTPKILRDGMMRWWGKSRSGVRIIGITYPDGVIRTGYPDSKGIRKNSQM